MRRTTETVAACIASAAAALARALCSATAFAAPAAAPAAAAALAALIGASTAAAAQVPSARAAEAEAFRDVAALLAARCGACHAGPRAAMGMRLTAERLYRDTVNVPARSDRRLRRVDPGNPRASLLYLKLLDPSDGHYSGPRMPLEGPPLSELERALVRTWIESFPRDRWGRPEPRSEPVKERIFPDSHLAQLPAAETLEPGMMQFRILHRFRQEATQAGAGGLYGLDGGADISFGLAYGFSERFEAGLRRSNLGRDYEALGKIALLRPGGGRPFAAALHLSASRLDEDGRFNRNRSSAQLLLSTRLGRRWSVLLAPSWASNTNWLDPTDSRGTSAIGLGGAYRLNSFLSLTGEWVHPLSGVKRRYDGASIGLAIGTSKHVFHLLLTNTRGAHTDLYLPGGDLDFGGGDFRLGFNISRLFDLRRSPAGPPAPPASEVHR